MLRHLRTRPRLLAAAIAGVVAACAATGIASPLTRALLGWNVSAWLFLGLMALMERRSDHERVRRLAIAQAESAATVLAIVILAAVMSVAAIVVELAAAKQPGTRHALSHALFALSTVTASWLLLPTLFAMSYASLYYRHPNGEGLNFPGGEASFHPDYGDFLYFSFTIAVASQTADVAISTRPMRRLVLLQSVLSFAFNTTILAFTINIAASLF
jgi:uncharacterized membrane protein